MIISREREKLIEAILYFCKGTRHCHTLKLFKLLNFLDFEHFRQTGRTVTGLDYAAWERGPVPGDLWRELKDRPGKDILDAMAVVSLRDETTGEVTRRDIKPKRPFNPDIFTKRELGIMARLSEIFSEARGDTMSDFSHFKRLPWRRVWDGGKGKYQPIPADLALDSEPLDPSAETVDRDDLRLLADLRRGIA